MRHAAYLTTSRHGVFYFRWPIPPALHPDNKRSDVKVSLSTRSPEHALRASRLLVIAGQSALVQASVRAMRYDEIRQHVTEHFRDLLNRFKESVASNGPRPDEWVRGFSDNLSATNEPMDAWLELSAIDGVDALVDDFCQKRGIADELSASEKQRMAEELQKGYRQYLAGALSHNASFQELDLDQSSPSEVAPKANPEPALIADSPSDETMQEVIDAYLDENRRVSSWTAKTLDEKRDALSMLSEITNGLHPAAFTKTEARTVKNVLVRLPKNRRKMPATRNLPLMEAIEVSGVEAISAVTVNGYLSNFRAFFKWAEDNYAGVTNPFAGVTVPKPKGKAAKCPSSEFLGPKAA